MQKRRTPWGMAARGLAGAVALYGAACGVEPQSPAASSDWLRQLGTSQEDTLSGLATAEVAGSRPVYVVGSTLGRVAGYTGDSADSDALIIRISDGTRRDGSVTFQTQLGTKGAEAFRAVAVDSQGNAYAVGYTTGTFPGQTRSGGSTDALVARIKPDGTVDWVKQLGTDGDDYLLGAALDPGGNLVTVGWTSGTYQGQVTQGPSDMFLARLAPDGTVLKVVLTGSTADDNATGVAVDAGGTVFVSGWSKGAVVAGQSPLGGRDPVVLRFDSSLSLVWGRQFGSADSDEASAIASDGSGVYVGGFTIGTLTGQTSQGRQDGFVARLDYNGTQTWVRQLGTRSDEAVQAVAADPGGDGVVAGGFTGYQFAQTQSLGKQDAFLVRLGADGTTRWTYQFGGADDDDVKGLAMPAAGTVLATGITKGTLPTQVSLGGQDGYAARFTPLATK